MDVNNRIICLVVGDVYNEFESVMALSPITMEKVGIYQHDILTVIGSKRREASCRVLIDQNLQHNKISLSRPILKNICARPGDSLLLTKPSDFKIARKIHILPFGHTNKDFKVNVFRFIGPYFLNRERSLKKGHKLFINNDSKSAEFKIIETQPLNDCVVNKETEFFCEGENIKQTTIENYDSVGFDDVGGMSRQISLLRELVELPLRQPHLFEHNGIKPPTGILIYGPPGSGKTLLARALANETGAYFFVLNGPEVMSKFAGETENNLRMAFESCEKNSPSLLFIDEIDSIAPKREKTEGELERRVVSQLLTLMDGLKTRSYIAVIGATNRPNSIDPALRRFGRFDREIMMGVPDQAARLQIIDKHTRNMKLNHDVNLKQLSIDTKGYIAADLASLCEKAALQSSRESIPRQNFACDFNESEVIEIMPIKHAHFTAALQISHPSVLLENVVELPSISWDDIGGLSTVREELEQLVKLPVEHAKEFSKFGISPNRGVLFYGPPGCGKTLLAQAVANEIKVNFISIKGPELLTKWYGESESNIREIFEKARQTEPCILFFDEFDSIACRRGSHAGGDSGVSDRVINQLLTEMSGISERKNVFIIGATNRPDIIDPALLRPGRLDRLIYIPLPDIKSRVSIFKATLRKSPIAEDVDICKLARITEGFSGADIKEICNSACKYALKESISKSSLNKEGLTSHNNALKSEDYVVMDHFKEALKFSRRSVNDSDIRRYETFAQSLTPTIGSGTETCNVDTRPSGITVNDTENNSWQHHRNQTVSSEDIYE